jgi:hypothetical protein
MLVQNPLFAAAKKGNEATPKERYTTRILQIKGEKLDASFTSSGFCAHVADLPQGDKLGLILTGSSPVSNRGSTSLRINQPDQQVTVELGQRRQV